jgi:hypothetical protein
MLTTQLKMLAITCLLLLCSTASAVETAVSDENLSVLNYLTDQSGKYTGPTVEDNVFAMDTDKNGFADVYEVRAFLVFKHGKDYQKALLDRWEIHAVGGSCPIPFAKEFYTDKVN